MFISLWSSLSLLWFVDGILSYSWQPRITSFQGLQNSANLTKESEVAAIRTYFYVGGKYVTDSTGMHHLKDQIYVERLVPAGGAKWNEPLIFIHGAGQTGTNWLNTPDGRRGWASWFLQRGYVVYIIDQPQRGRSPYFLGDGSLVTMSAEYVSQRYTAIEKFNVWPQARLHTQWPGTGERGDPVFDAFYASQIQYQNDSVITQTLNQNAGAALLDLIGPSIIVTHSQSGPSGFLIADVRPSLVRALVNLEPMGPPFEEAVFNPGRRTRPYGLTTIPLNYSPPIDNVTTDLATVKVPSTNPERSDCLLQASSTPRKLRNLAKVPMLLVTSEASYHALYDYCIVRYLRQGGVDVEHLEMSREGIHGNGHLFFLEKNNLAIAARLKRWIRKFSSPIANSTAST